MDARIQITYYLESVSKCYAMFETIVTDILTKVENFIEKLGSEQNIISEIKQIIKGLVTGLKNAEFNAPSFTVPLTDLVVPSMKVSMDNLHQFEIPAQLDIPEFTILGFRTVQATTISIDDIKQRIIELIDLIINFEIKIVDMDAFFGDLTMNYLPVLPEFSIPEMTVSDISFPALPYIPTEKVVTTLQLPEFKIPVIPREIVIPGFDKLSGEMKVISPIYTIRNAAEASAETTVKATTASYNAELLNEAFLATKGGLSATSDTTYNHMLNSPMFGFTGELSMNQKALARQEGTTLTLTVGNQGNGAFNSHDMTHKSDLHITINPSTGKMTFISDTDTFSLKMKQTLSADFDIFRYFKFDVHSEAEGPAIKNSLLMGSGSANVDDMKFELKATHNTELVGTVDGDLYNVINIVIHPTEVMFNFQNRGNTPRPISIPEIELPFVDFRTPAISDLNLYEQTGLKHILTTTEQTIDVDAKIVYKKSQLALLVDVMGWIWIPSVGNLISELSFKFSIINLNVNAALYAEDDLTFHLGATSASLFEGLRAKLDGTTSLTTKRGIKLANSLFLENHHNEGTHESTITVSTETLDAAVSVASSLTADIGIDLSQSSTLGDLIISEKMVVDMTTANQKISSNAKFVSPLYTTNVVAEIEGNAPVYKVTLKSSATSAFVFLDYELDSSVTISFENAGVSLTVKAVLTHTDLIMDIQHVLSHTMSDSRLTLNVDLISLAFTDVNLRFAARKDGISATISIPSTGLLGLQCHGRIPSQMNARLYGRYALDPGNDVDMLLIRASAKNGDKVNLKVVFNMDVPGIMLSGLQQRVPAITSSLTGFAEKYQLSKHATQLKSILSNYIEDAYNAANSHAPQLSQMSILFRNTVVQYQKVFLETAIKVLRETQFKLPGSEKMTTLSEALKTLTTHIAVTLEEVINMVAANVESAFNAVINMISNIQVTMPIGDVMTGAQIMDQIRVNIKIMFNCIVDLVKNLESLDILLEELGDTLKYIVDKSQEFIDKLKSDTLDVIAVYINAFYVNFVSLMRKVTNYANTVVDIEYISGTIDYILDIVRSVVNQFDNIASDYLNQAPAQFKSYVNIENRRLEINL
ncbi:hypothetical protein LDENG_00057010 [Lucifuga dentata]|nr:hypothetical protein LDENG_00057010 [Lucifuga dentata]